MGHWKLGVRKPRDRDVMSMNDGASTGSSGWWNIGFALCLTGVALTTPRLNWVFWVGAAVYAGRAVYLFYQYGKSGFRNFRSATHED